MSNTRILNAMATLVTTETNIVQVAIQKGISIDATPAGTPQFPALQLNAPDTHGQRAAIGPGGPYEPIVQVHIAYVNKATSSTQTWEELLEAADATLDQVLANVLSNGALTVDGTDNCVEMTGWDKHLDRVPGDIGFGFPVVTGYLIIAVKDFWVRFTP